MHDSTVSSFLGSEEDGSPTCSSDSDDFEYSMPSLLSSQCGGGNINSTIYFTDHGLYNPNHEMLSGPHPYGNDFIIDLMALESGSEGVGAKLSEARMAARRAEEAGNLQI